MTIKITIFEGADLSSLRQLKKLHVLILNVEFFFNTNITNTDTFLEAIGTEVTLDRLDLATTDAKTMDAAQKLNNLHSLSVIYFAQLPELLAESGVVGSSFSLWPLMRHGNGLQRLIRNALHLKVLKLKRIVFSEKNPSAADSKFRNVYSIARYLLRTTVKVDH